MTHPFKVEISKDDAALIVHALRNLPLPHIQTDPLIRSIAEQVRSQEELREEEALMLGAR